LLTDHFQVARCPRAAVPAPDAYVDYDVAKINLETANDNSLKSVSVGSQSRNATCANNAAFGNENTGSPSSSNRTGAVSVAQHGSSSTY
jgi:hypothetical protein